MPRLRLHAILSCLLYTSGAGHRDYLENAAAQTGRLAFERAGVKHADIDMGMIYDSFTITVISQLENLGFCKRGDGGAFVSEMCIRDR